MKLGEQSLQMTHLVLASPIHELVDASLEHEPIVQIKALKLQLAAIDQYLVQLQLLSLYRVGSQKLIL